MNEHIQRYSEVCEVFFSHLELLNNLCFLVLSVCFEAPRLKWQDAG